MPPFVALGILAGGKASRLGGIDKALARYDGRTLVERALGAAGPAFAERLVSYNRPAQALGAFAVRCIPDSRAGHLGPLSGIESLLGATRCDWLLTLPVDLQHFPVEVIADWTGTDLRPRALRDADGLQPLVALWPTSALGSVRSALDDGRGAAHALIKLLDFQVTDISPLAVGNLNLPRDFR